MTNGLTLCMIVLVPCFVSTALEARSCESLSKLVSPTASITLAKTTQAETFTPGDGTKAIPNLPAFCQVAANLKPTSDSDIRAEIWLPLSGWNGKFFAVGSGGWGGSLNYDDMADALRRGYATSSTDDGHTSPGASFIVGYPEKFVDFAYRAEHEMTVEAKALIKAFYDREARYSYWDGCSGGGREGLLQAYRYPDEFDGIIAGDPANIRRNALALWLAVQTFKDATAHIPPEKYPMIHRAVLDACDANDGLKDGLIEDPESCHVDFKVLQCQSEDGPNCLTPRQVQIAQTIIKPATTESVRSSSRASSPGPNSAGLALPAVRALPISFWTSFVMSCTTIPTGTGGASTWSANPPRRTRLTKTWTTWIPISRPRPNTAVSCSSIMVGPISR